MLYEIEYINHFTRSEIEQIDDYIKNNINDLELTKGQNCSVDVTHAIGRTANVDIYVFSLD